LIHVDFFIIVDSSSHGVIVVFILAFP